MPYQVAQYWERGVRQQVQDKTSRLQATRKKQQLQSGSATGLGVGEVPRDLREYAKRSPLVKNWVRTLEEPVRDFLHGEGSRAAEKERQEMAAAEEELDSDEEEIVFAGRQGALKELQEKKDRWRLAHREIAQETVDSGMVFDSFGDDESAAYKYVFLLRVWEYVDANRLQALVDSLDIRLLRARVSVGHYCKYVPQGRLCWFQEGEACAYAAFEGAA